MTAIFHSWFKLRWTPSSRAWLMHLDQKIRSRITHKNHGRWIRVNFDDQQIDIWTVFVEGEQRNKVPFVFVHGMGGGSNMFFNNIDALAKERDVILLDLPGFGLSSRPELRVRYKAGWWVDTTEDDIEEFYTEVLELWFRKMNLKKIILIGHSYGGYLSSVYCLRYSWRVLHLILVDPWGFPHRPALADMRPFMRSKPLHLLSKLYAKMNVFTPIRALGPIGPAVFRKLRGDLGRKFGSFDMSTSFQNYLYACNTCDAPSGEVGFSRVSIPFAWARKPMLDRVVSWSERLDVTFVFGARSWVSSQSGYETQNQRHDNYVDVHVISGAGHHVYADRPNAFNGVLQAVGRAVDGGQKPIISHENVERHLAMSSLRRRSSCVSQAEMCNDEAGIRQPRSHSEHELSGDEDSSAYVYTGSETDRGPVAFSLGPAEDEEEELKQSLATPNVIVSQEEFKGRERKTSFRTASRSQGAPLKNVKFSKDVLGSCDNVPSREGASAKGEEDDDDLYSSSV